MADLLFDLNEFIERIIWFKLFYIKVYDFINNCVCFGKKQVKLDSTLLHFPVGKPWPAYFVQFFLLKICKYFLCPVYNTLRESRQSCHLYAVTLVSRSLFDFSQKDYFITPFFY